MYIVELCAFILYKLKSFAIGKIFQQNICVSAMLEITKLPRYTHIPDAFKCILLHIFIFCKAR